MFFQKNFFETPFPAVARRGAEPATIAGLPQCFRRLEYARGRVGLRRKRGGPVPGENRGARVSLPVRKTPRSRYFFKILPVPTHSIFLRAGGSRPHSPWSSPTRSSWRSPSRSKPRSSSSSSLSSASSPRTASRSNTTPSSAPTPRPRETEEELLLCLLSSPCREKKETFRGKKERAARTAQIWLPQASSTRRPRSSTRAGSVFAACSSRSFCCSAASSAPMPRLRGGWPTSLRARHTSFAPPTRLFA